MVMNVAEHVGLLWGFGWVVTGSLPAVIFTQYMITPIGFVLVGLVMEGRVVPLGKGQFRSFMPGDLFLGAFVSALIYAARNITDDHHWFQDWRWHVLLLIGTLVAGVALTLAEYDRSAVIDYTPHGDPADDIKPDHSYDRGYPARSIFSWTKIYHNIGLYGLYGYVVFSLIVAVAFGSHWTQEQVITVATAAALLAIWGVFLYVDNTLDDETASYKRSRAHPRDWQPIIGFCQCIVDGRLVQHLVRYPVRGWRASEIFGRG